MNHGKDALPSKAKRIRYIKLGRNRMWWNECKLNNRIRLGFDSGLPKINEMATAGDWEAIRAYWENRTGTPTHHTNQTKEFFEDKGDTLWITFEDGCLYHGFSDGSHPIPISADDKSEASSYRGMAGTGWSNLDAKGNELRIETLSGKLTKTAGYRQTICALGEEEETYLRDRLAGKVSPDIESAEVAKRSLIEAMKVLIKSLTWRDFELLIELIFANSGWRRTSATGGSQKTTDLDLLNPVTGDMAFVQVKSKTSQTQLLEYQSLHSQERGSFDRMYFVYHSGKIDRSALDDSTTLWNVHDVAAQVVQNGLVDWVIMKAK